MVGDNMQKRRLLVLAGLSVVIAFVLVATLSPEGWMGRTTDDAASLLPAVERDDRSSRTTRGGSNVVAQQEKGQHQLAVRGSWVLSSETIDDEAAELSHPPPADDGDAVDAFFRSGGRVVGVVFYGRRRYTHVQLPYLFANRRGATAPDGTTTGILDQVLFIANTDDRDDLAYIHNATASSGGFLKLEDVAGRKAEIAGNNAGYCSFYSALTGPGSIAKSAVRTLYLKFDDDLVYVHPGAFRAMLRLKLTSDFLIVSGNVVNHPMLSHAHQRVGVFDTPVVARAVREAKAYAAAARRGGNASAPQVTVPPDWRTSLRFPYCGLCYEGWQSAQHAVLEHWTFLSRLSCRSRRRRALHGAAAAVLAPAAAHGAADAVSSHQSSLISSSGGGRTGVSMASGSGVTSAAAAAQAAQQAPTALSGSAADVPDPALWADDCLGPYKFHLWDFDAIDRDRWSINCILFDPAEMAGVFSVSECAKSDDEEYITRVLPAVMNRHSAAAGEAIVVHLAYWPQRKGGVENTTDILDRYGELASEVAKSLGRPIPGYAAERLQEQPQRKPSRSMARRIASQT